MGLCLSKFEGKAGVEELEKVLEAAKCRDFFSISSTLNMPIGRRFSTHEVLYNRTNTLAPRPDLIDKNWPKGIQSSPLVLLQA